MSDWNERIVGDGLGVELDLDVSEPLSRADELHLQDLYREHGLLLIHGPIITRARHSGFVSLFGPVVEKEAYGNGDVSNEPGGTFGTVELLYHWDANFAPEPILGVSLHAIDVVDGASSTCFASMNRAYERLPDALKTRIEGLETIHVMPVDTSVRTRAAEVPDIWPRATHPLVKRHAVTGRPLLYISEMDVDCIVGLPEQESEQLIAELIGYIKEPSNVYEHFWYLGDLLVWDNNALQHARGEVSSVGRRVLQRVTIARPGTELDVQFPQFHEAYEVHAAKQFTS